MDIVLIILFAITLIYSVSITRLTSLISLLAIQGIILFFVALLKLNEHIDWLHMIFITAETLVFKAVAVPYFLHKTVKNNRVNNYIETVVPRYFSVILISFVIVSSFILANSLHEKTLNIKYFTISISAMFTGIFIVISCSKIITHIVGYMILENGIFLLSLSIGQEMPIIISTGILLDVFASVVILLVLVNQIANVVKHFGADALSELKD